VLQNGTDVVIVVVLDLGDAVLAQVSGGWRLILKCHIFNLLLLTSCLPVEEMMKCMRCMPHNTQQ
jgi:hypothetical protein